MNSFNNQKNSIEKEPLPETFRNHSLRKWIAMDFGTANVRMLIPGKEHPVIQASAVTVDQDTGEIRSIGNEALDMLDRTSDHIAAFRPFCKSRLPSDIVGKMIAKWLRESVQKSLLRPDLILSVPTGVSGKEKGEWVQQAKEAGVRQVAFIEPVLASSIGSGWNPESTQGYMIVDIGGNMTSVAVLSAGSLAFSRILPIGGDQFDQAVMKYFRRRNEMLITQSVAETVKRTIGSVYDELPMEPCSVSGRDVHSGAMKQTTVRTVEMIEVLAEPVAAIVDAVCSLVEQLPETLLDDVLYSGMILTGGGSKLNGLDRLLTRVTGIPAHLASGQPENCGINGLGKLMDRHSRNWSYPLTWY